MPRIAAGLQDLQGWKFRHFPTEQENGKWECKGGKKWEWKGEKKSESVKEKKWEWGVSIPQEGQAAPRRARAFTGRQSEAIMCVPWHVRTPKYHNRNTVSSKTYTHLGIMLFLLHNLDKEPWAGVEGKPKVWQDWWCVMGTGDESY